MKKRILSLVLVLILLVGILPLSAQASSNDALVAYNDFVQEIITKYGIADGTQYEGSYGLADAAIFDFNGDGTQELGLAWGENGNSRCGIFTYENGAVKTLWENGSDEFTGIFNVFAVKVGNASYLAYGMTRHFYGVELACVDGKYVESSGEWTEADDERASEAGQAGGLMDEGNMRLVISLEKHGIYTDGYSGETIWSYISEGAFQPSEELSSTLATLQNATYANLSFEETKAKLPYTGDLSKINLTPEQATAFAEVLRGYNQSSFKVSFFDGGNGIPIMWVALNESTGSTANGLITTSYFWEWTGTKAVQCSGTPSYGNYRFLPEDSTLNHKDPPYDGDAGEYTVNVIKSYNISNGKIDTVNHGSCISVYASLAYGDRLLHPLEGYYDDFVCTLEDWNIDEENEGAVLYLKDLSPVSKTVYDEEYDKINPVSDPNPDELGVKLEKWGVYLEYKPYGTWADGSTVQTLLTNYATLAEGHYTYPDLTDDDALVKAITQALADKLGGKIVGLYKLADGLYYVIIDVGGSESGAVVQSIKKNGVPSYKLVESHKTPLPQKELKPYINDYLSRSNVTIDYNKTTHFKSTDDYTGYLKDVLNNVAGDAPNDAAKGKLVTYIENAISEISTEPIKCRRNKITVRDKDIVDCIKNAQIARDEFSAVLEENGVALNKEITIIVRIVGSKIDMGKPLQVTLDKAVAESLQGATLHILLGDGAHALRITQADLKALFEEHGAISVQIELSEDGKYTINFLDESGAVLERICAPITVFLPTASPYSTVFASYKGGSDNWGGQYDSNNGTISFNTVFSGVYEIIENAMQISDIGELGDEEANAIRFMVSKGYFTLDENGAFYPDAELTRYDFTAALVGMFFALDRELKASFPDVPEDSDYYAYVASAEADKIVNGFDDGSFGGDRNITCEQVLALAARTLADKKGYSYPESPMDYLSFDGGENVSEWAIEALALASREGIVAKGERLEPTGDISRSDAALYLYRLFMLLYEVSPVSIAMDSASAGGELPVPALVGIGAAALLLLIGGALFLIKRKKAAGTTSTNAEGADESDAAPSGADEASDNLDDEAERKVSETEEAEVK